jgi:hypothetical protein
MKTTSYFNFTRIRPDRAGIQDEWICFVIEHPEKPSFNLMAESRNGRIFRMQEKHYGSFCLKMVKPFIMPFLIVHTRRAEL